MNYEEYTRKLPGWQEVEPEEEDPLKKWKAHPVKKREHKEMEFIEETMR